MKTAPDPDGGEQIERGAHRFRSAQLTCVRNHAESAVAGESERLHVGLGRVVPLATAKAEADHATVTIGERVSCGLERCLERVAAGNLRCQPTRTRSPPLASCAPSQ